MTNKELIGVRQLFNAMNVMNISQFEELIVGHQELLLKGIHRLNTEEISKCEPLGLAAYYLSQNTLRDQLIKENPGMIL